MKKLSTTVLVALAGFGLLLVLSACQSLPPAGKGAPGIEVPQGSTGDPPSIPHEVAAGESGEQCNGCHARGEMGAPKSPAWHATLVDCRQCHLPAPEPNVKPFRPSY